LEQLPRSVATTFLDFPAIILLYNLNFALASPHAVKKPSRQTFGASSHDGGHGYRPERAPDYVRSFQRCRRLRAMRAGFPGSEMNFSGSEEVDDVCGDVGREKSDCDVMTVRTTSGRQSGIRSSRKEDLIMLHPFTDRRAAGRLLAAMLDSYRGRTDVTILALPRGGVPVAAEIAAALGAPLDILTVRKLGVPGQPELAMGAVAAGGTIYLDPATIEYFDITQEEIDVVLRREMHELERRERLYRGDAPELHLAGRTVILVDDGIATGATARAAIRAVRALDAATVLVATPVASAATCRELRLECDGVFCARAPDMLEAVGFWYDSFPEVSDTEVLDLLARARPARRPDSGATGAA
jgi:predicted phosphoribosyltransferase